MGTKHPNAMKFEAALEAFGRGDLQTLATEHFSPDIVWSLAGKSPVAGTYKGIDEVFGFFRTLMELSGGTFHVEPHAILADDDHIVLLATAQAERSDGRKLEVGECLVMHVADGRETEVWHSQYDRDEWDAFWA